MPIKHCEKNIIDTDYYLINHNLFYLMDKKDMEYIMNSEKLYKDLFYNILEKYSNLIISYEHKVFVSRYDRSIFNNLGNIFYNDLITLNNKFLNLLNELPRNNSKNLICIFIVKCIQYSIDKFTNYIYSLN